MPQHPHEFVRHEGGHKVKQTNILVELSVSEISYLIRCGGALTAVLPEKSLPTYCGFTSEQIFEFSGKMRSLLSSAGFDL